MLEQITQHNQRIAVIIYADQNLSGTHFVTEETDGLQVGMIQRNAREIIPAHKHQAVDLQYHGIKQEFIYIVEGVVKVTFYADDDTVISEKLLKAGDAMLQISGGHRFEFIENGRLIEVKQGPYINQQLDKVFIRNVTDRPLTDNSQ